MRKKLNQTKNTPDDNRGVLDDQLRSLGLYSIWLGVRDSNPRMLVPKTSVLPLDEPPTCNRTSSILTVVIKFWY